MLTERPYVVMSSNLSLAWGEALLRTLSKPSDRLTGPIIVSISEFDEDYEVVENATIRNALDIAIVGINDAKCKPKLHRVDATAQTIFPHMCWTPQRQRPHNELRRWYMDHVLPKLKKRCRNNARGTYFERMLNFPAANKKREVILVDQLGDIIGWIKNNKSMPINKAMQVVIRDPGRDQIPSQSEFPCLQQVSFSRDREKLVLSAYYPTENILERGYGNYLGLCRLGCYMAHSSGLKLARVNIFVTQPRLDTRKTIEPVLQLKQAVKDELERNGTTAGGS